MKELGKKYTKEEVIKIINEHNLDAVEISRYEHSTNHTIVLNLRFVHKLKKEK